MAERKQAVKKVLKDIETDENIKIKKIRGSQKMTKAKKVKRFLKSKLFGIILSVIQLLFTIIFLGLLLYLNILPIKYFLPLTFILLFLSAYTFLTMQSKKFRTLGKVVAVLFTIVYCVGIYYVGSVNGMFNNISGADEKIDIMNVYVLKSDSADKLSDAKDYKFGILKSLDRDNTDKTIQKIEDDLDRDIAVEEFESWTGLIDALYEGKVKAIILNQSYMSFVTDTEGYKTFEEDTKVLYYNKIVTQLDVNKDKDITNNTFAMYISGIDVEGSISTTSRSDVNIIAVVNPDTKQILLLNTPRDYYVPLSISNGVKDKITHAGIYGVDVSMDSLEMLYDTEIDYYFRVNFTGFKNVINALGNVEVYSEYAFTTTHGGDYIKKGMNTLNGKQALGFVRERFAFGTGDNQRGKNQMALINAVIKKMASSAILNDFSGLMDSLSGSFETSLTSTQLSSLVRMQLDEGGSWNVVTYAVTGKGDNLPCYSLATPNYVMIPNEDNINNAKNLIQMIYDGKTISLDGIEK